MGEAFLWEGRWRLVRKRLRSGRRRFLLLSGEGDGRCRRCFLLLSGEVMGGVPEGVL